MIKPIETFYNGYKFRSRLEARWAVFFDTLGLKYQYEFEGFKMHNGDCYLPDFFLPNDKLFIEVKGIYPEEKYIKMLENFSHEIGLSVLLLVGIPGENTPELYCYDCTDSSGGIGWFSVDIFSDITKDGHICFYRGFDRTDRELMPIGIDGIAFNSYCHNDLIKKDFALLDESMRFIRQKAILKAKQARFEHGERYD